MEKNDPVIFNKDTVEFVTVAAEFCTFLEHSAGMNRKRFVDTLLKILPLLYLKASLLPPAECLGEEAPETYLTEEDYEILRLSLASIMGETDDYLEVFLQDMAYSDTPICKRVSEDLADIYQDIKNFVFVFKIGYSETMHDALAVCEENFACYWGQTLVNTLRALHDVKYNKETEEYEEGHEGRGDEENECTNNEENEYTDESGHSCGCGHQHEGRCDCENG